MNTLHTRLYEHPAPSAMSIALRQRVEDLESLREEACLLRDRDTVDNIDAQIKVAVCEWIDSLIAGLEAGLPSAHSAESKAA